MAIPAARRAGVVDAGRRAGLRRRRRVRRRVRGGAGAARAAGRARRRARGTGCRVCGPNGNGIVSLPDRVALWGDTVAPREPGPVALISQSGNVAVNALASRRGLRLHTVVSCGNEAVLVAGGLPGRARRAATASARSRSTSRPTATATRWCAALERCAAARGRRGGAEGGQPRRPARPRPRPTPAPSPATSASFRALFEEAGAAWAERPARAARAGQGAGGAGGRAGARAAASR